MTARQGRRSAIRFTGGLHWPLPLLLAALLLASPARADLPSDQISRIKAAFIFNIAKFVHWPPARLDARPGHFMVCFYRENFLGRGFDSIRDKQIQHHPLAQQVIDGVQSASQCDLLLIPWSQLHHFRQHDGELPATHALSIADLTPPAEPPTDAHRVAMVNLVRAGSSIAFEVNLERVRQSGLSMSSELLKLARIIGSEGR